MGLTKGGLWLVVLSVLLGVAVMVFAYRTHLGVPSQRLQAVGWSNYLKIKGQPNPLVFVGRCLRDGTCRKAYSQITPPFTPTTMVLYLSPVILWIAGIMWRQPISPMRENPMTKFTQPAVAKGYLYRTLPKPRIPSGRKDGSEKGSEKGNS